jgi:cytochrome c-type biogenesis protein CcmH/NrfG
MGWLAMVLIALATAAALYPFARRDKVAVQFLAAALLVALAGYSWQGRPNQPGSPKGKAEIQTVPDDDFATLRPALLGRFDRAAYWMQLADAARREGNPHSGALILQTAVGRNPDSLDLWIGYGYSLVADSGDMMSPAALLAFERADRLARGHPGPRFFYALALARGGNYGEAERVWRELLPSVPEASQYRAAIAERLAAIAEARSNGGLVRPAPPLAETEPEGQAVPSLQVVQ